MGTKRRITKQSGYPTSDQQSFSTLHEAMVHQTGLDLSVACETSVEIDGDELKTFLKDNHEVVSEYIKHNLVKKPAPKKRAAPKKKSSN